MLGKSTATIRRMVNDGRLEGVSNGRSLRIDPESVLPLLNRSGVSIAVGLLSAVASGRPIPAENSQASHVATALDASGAADRDS